MDDPVDSDGNFPDFDPTMATFESESGSGSVAGGGSSARLGGSSRGQPVGEDEVREQDRYLPVANIARIMKRVLPANEKITKEAKEAVQECVSEFVSFITSEASDRCQQEKRKTINGEDLLWAMGTLGLDDYGPPLKTYLSKYRQAAKKPEGAAASNSAASSSSSSSSGSVVSTPKRDNKSEEAAPWAPALHAMYTLGTQGPAAAAAADHSTSSSSSSSFSPSANTTTTTTTAPIPTPAIAGPASAGVPNIHSSQSAVNPVTQSTPAAVASKPTSVQNTSYSTSQTLNSPNPLPAAPSAAASAAAAPASAPAAVNSSGGVVPPTPAQLAAQAQVQKALDQQALQQRAAAAAATSPRVDGPTQREMELEKQREKQIAAAAQVQAALEAEAAKKKTAAAKRPREE